MALAELSFTIMHEKINVTIICDINKRQNNNKALAELSFKIMHEKIKSFVNQGQVAQSLTKQTQPQSEV